MLVVHLLYILDISWAVVYFPAFQINIVPTNGELVPWRSVMFSDAEALLFQSAIRPLIAVKSIHVATNEMEEILQLLTERDIEHTNNPPPLVPTPTHILRSSDTRSSLTQSIFLCLSLRLSQSISSSVHFTNLSYIQADASIYSEAGSLSTYLLITAELPKLPSLI